MSLSETTGGRLADVRELETTRNGELRERWDMDSGKEVAAYLRNELGEYTYHDVNDKIRAMAEADVMSDTEPSHVGPDGQPGDSTDKRDAYPLRRTKQLRLRELGPLKPTQKRPQRWPRNLPESRARGSAEERNRDPRPTLLLTVVRWTPEPARNYLVVTTRSTRRRSSRRYT